MTVPYTCSLGETVTLDFDLSVFEHSCGFRFDPLLEDSSMVRLEEIALTYEDGETKEIEFSSRPTAMWILSRFLCTFIKIQNFSWTKPCP